MVDSCVAATNSKAMSDQDSPQLSEYAEMIIAQRLFETRTLIPAHVLSFSDDPRPMATVELAPQARRRVEGGKIEWIIIPPLVDVPLMELKWGPLHVRANLERDDDVVCLIADRDIDEWLLQGGGTYRPGTALIHDINDAMILPMLEPNSKASIRKKPGTRQLIIGDTTGAKCEIELDEAASSITVKAAGTVKVSGVRVELDAFAGLPGGPFNVVGVNAAGLCTHVTSVAPGGGPVVWTPNAGQVVIP
jgi:hypothetical protein